MPIQEINTSNDNMLLLIRKCIQEKTGLSIARLGDGEIHILNKNLTDSLAILFKHKFGYDNPMDGLLRTRSLLLDVMHNTSYIGIMGDNDISKLLNIKRWHLDKTHIIESNRKIKLNTFDCMLVRDIKFGSLAGFKSIINNKPICIVTPIVDKLKQNDLAKHLGVHVSYVEVPMGGNLDDRESYFKLLDDIQEDIVIIANSLYGKDFPYYLGNKGKVCIDMGATLDGWAGIESRKWFKKGNLQDHCVIRKENIK